jgi:hypothetical protein
VIIKIEFWVEIREELRREKERVKLLMVEMRVPVRWFG